MALTKKQKLQLAEQYKDYLAKAKNVVVVKQSWVPVNDMTVIRKWLFGVDGMYKVVKKRVFLKAIESTDNESVDESLLEDSVAILCAYDDEYAPLKVVHKNNTWFKKEKKKYGFEYVGGWFDGKRESAEHVAELASIPSKEELVAKLLYLMKYPIQSFAVALTELEKKAEWKDCKVSDLVEKKSEEASE